MAQQLDLFGSPIPQPTIKQKSIVVEVTPVVETNIKSSDVVLEEYKKITPILLKKPSVETVYEALVKRQRGRPRKPKALIEEPKIKQKRGRKSYTEIAANVDLIDVPDDEVLNEKQYYSISLVAKWFNVTNSQIRFWENEFDILKPKKNKKGDRLFRPEDVKNLKTIYYLIRQRKFSIEGAKDYLKANQHKTEFNIQLQQSLQSLKLFLLELKTNL